MQFSDNELMMLEQLCYLNKDIYKDAGISYRKPTVGSTVGDIVNSFNEDALMELENNGSESQQWAAIIRNLQSNEELCELQLVDEYRTFNEDDGDRMLAMVFNHPDEPEKAIVTFNGTNGSVNWFDNATGLGTSDTVAQKNALNFINGLSYNNLTVVGHSKGGNLAQYVTITSDKVDRCISMDGQGFSQEFLDKYWAEINLNGSKITNYSLTGDFVHILLYPVPGSTQDYCLGDRVDSFEENHYTNSFFQYDTVKDENGNTITVIRLNENGDPNIINGQKENEMMTYLHEFTCFALSTMPADERVEMGDFIGNILKLSMTGVPVEVNGVVYTNLQDYIVSDEEMFSKLLAYVAKYVDEYDLGEDEIKDLLELLGYGFIVTEFEEFQKEHPIISYGLVSGAGGILKFILGQLDDGKEDKLIGLFLDWLSDKFFDGEVNMKRIWQKTEKEYGKIPKVKSGANKNSTCRKERVYKYTDDIYQKLMDAISSLDSVGGENISNWNAYAGSSWFSKISVNVMAHAIKHYNNRLDEINKDAKRQIENSFSAVARLDKDCANAIEEKVFSVGVLSQALK